SEIEGAVLSYEGIVEAAVTVMEKSGNKYIVAYYTGASPDVQTWQEFLKPLLPEYMLPAFYVHLDSMPITPGGKIDKRALPAPDVETEREGYEPPVNSIQEQLCEIFEKALGMEKVGINDNFFELGGTSLTASKIAVLCMAKKLPVVYADIFKYPTVRQLAAGVCEDSVEETVEKDEISSHNYNKVDRILLPNRAKNADLVKKEEVGDILLTGATGFLGIHVLKTFLDSYEGTVYALVRKGKYPSSEKRLMNMLMYYFDDPCEELFGKRIICIDGDITDLKSLESLKEYPFKTLINCAACVKHFSSDDTLQKINVDGVRNLIGLCSELNRRLIQISTVSVAGEGMGDKPGVDRDLCEHELYIGQRIANEYIRTKFLAERYILEAVHDGLDAKVIRVGNLMSRNSDGEFQINFVTNGFLRGVRGYVAVGMFPVSGMNESAEFSPIDSTAEAILKLAGTDKNFTVYHACNSHHIFMGDLIYAMKNHGFEIQIVSDDQFEQAVNDYAAAHEDSEAVSGLIAYASRDGEQVYTVGYKNRFTTEVLYRLGYKWPITDDKYLENAINALDKLGFFG
ncbi:MAG: NAD-dependent epimerase/dehydratase family protein, partial [Lachnospiraceae bacterium]|nr:NAD-dependent epimerase/dehydratase family protein [Lachnospiraceae bacterium]